MIKSFHCSYLSRALIWCDLNSVSQWLLALLTMHNWKVSHCSWSYSSEYCEVFLEWHACLSNEMLSCNWNAKFNKGQISHDFVQIQFFKCIRFQNFIYVCTVLWSYTTCLAPLTPPRSASMSVCTQFHALLHLLWLTESSNAAHMHMSVKPSTEALSIYQEPHLCWKLPSLLPAAISS